MTKIQEWEPVYYTDTQERTKETNTYEIQLGYYLFVVLTQLQTNVFEIHCDKLGINNHIFNADNLNDAKYKALQMVVDKIQPMLHDAYNEM